MTTKPIRILDTATGDRDLDAATLAAILSETPQPLSVTTLNASGAAVLGSQTTSGLNAVSVEGGITAGTTQTIAGGYALTKEVNIISTCANTGDAVTLADLAVGEYQDVYNDGANAASVFPHAAGVQIDGGTAGAAATLTNAKRCRYLCDAANSIISAQLGAVSA